MIRRHSYRIASVGEGFNEDWTWEYMRKKSFVELLRDLEARAEEIPDRIVIEHKAHPDVREWVAEL